jgi:hypothetical protein
MKVVINGCFGGFGLSEQALNRIAELGGPAYDWSEARENGYRSHPAVVQAVEELGDKANGRYAELAVIEVPDDVEWDIDEYDGLESVHEKHRVWR